MAGAAVVGWAARGLAPPRAASTASSALRFARGSRRWASFYDRTVTRWSDMTPPVVTMADLIAPPTAVDEATLIADAVRVNMNVAIRLAQRIEKINKMPFIFGINPNVHRLYHLYHAAFAALSAIPPPTSVREALRMSQELYPNLLSETTVVIPTLARASKELASKELEEVLEKEELTSFFDTMLSGRALRRLLMHHHLLLNAMYLDPTKVPSKRGVIREDIDVRDCIGQAADAARNICVEKFGTAPDFVVKRSPDRPIRYVQSHLVFMLLELFKNSARAVIEKHAADSAGTQWSGDGPLPPVEVEVYQTDADKGLVQIKVADKGGGITDEIKDAMFEYGFSTMPWEPDMTDPDAWPAKGFRRIRGEGFGLPMTRQYARFFHGDISVQSTIGFGTEVYLKIREPLAAGAII